MKITLINDHATIEILNVKHARWVKGGILVDYGYDIYKFYSRDDYPEIIVEGGEVKNG